MGQIGRAFVVIQFLGIVSVCFADDSVSPTLPPNARTAPPKLDILSVAIDPLVEGNLRVKFLQVSAPESAIDAKAFEDLFTKKNNLLRSFDRWSYLTRYDANHDGQIDVLEFLEYRRAFRIGVLHFFDGNHNRRLEGPERTKAIEALNSGWAPPLVSGLKQQEAPNQKSLDIKTQPSTIDASPHIDPVTYTTKIPFSHGASYVHIRNSLSKDDLPTLYTMLKAPQHATHWHMIANTIALLSDPGDDASVDVLLDYMRRSDAKAWEAMSEGERWMQAMGKVRATSWIGRLAPHRPDVRQLLQKALSVKGAEDLVKAWIDGPLPGKWQTDKDGEFLAHIQGWSALGLVLSGDEESRTMVRNIFDKQAAEIHAPVDVTNLFNGMGQAVMIDDYIKDHGITAWLELSGSGESLNQLTPYFRKIDPIHQQNQKIPSAIRAK